MKSNASNVLGALDKREVVLLDATARLDSWCVFTGKRFFVHHGDGASWADRFPWRRAHDGKVRVFQAAVRIVFVRDRIVEFPIFKHLGPDPAVDAAAQMLDKLTINERVDWWAGFGGI